MLAGGYTKFHALAEEDQKIFEAALSGTIGVSYEPFAVATQVVNGTNYKFLCNATAMTNPPREYTALITVYKPIGGDPVLQDITEITV